MKKSVTEPHRITQKESTETHTNLRNRPLEKPLIVTEGKTDPIYLRLAITKLSSDYPKLGRFINGKFSSTVRFLRYSHTDDKILHLGGGTGNIKDFISTYKKTIESFKFKPLAYPVIALIDNDPGAKDIFRVVKNMFNVHISYNTCKPFYYLCYNLYLVKTPENGADSKSCIEDMFDQEWRTYPVDGKTFDPSREHTADGKYGKVVFAKQVVMPNADRIDFSKFRKLLDRTLEVLDDYENKRQVSADS